MSYYSRLQRKQEKFNKQQIILLVLVSIILVVVVLYFGISFLFNLTSKISSMQHTNDTTTTQDALLAPNTPRISQDYDATSSANIKVAGAADPKTNVQLFQNGDPVDTKISSDQGQFSFDVTLQKGKNDFQVLAISDKGKKSDKSVTYSVSLATSAPKIDVSSPTDGDTLKDSPTVVSGKTDVGNSVTVNDHFIVVNTDGSFSYYLNLNDGDNDIKIVASDPAGNQTTKEIRIKYQK